MKKLFLFLLAAWGLTALSATARAAGETTTPTTTWTSPQPLTDYKLLNVYSKDKFVDLSKLVGTTQEKIKAQEDAGFSMVEALGEDIPTNADLNDYFFSIDMVQRMMPQMGGSGPMTEGIESGAAGQTSYKITKKITASDNKLTATAYREVDRLLFMEKPVKSLIISALGGIYFSTASMDDENYTSPEITASLPGTAIADIAASFGVSLYPYQDSTTLLTAKKRQDSVPAYFGAGIDEYGTFVVVQYNYSVNNTPWSFQIRCDSRGVVSMFVNNITCNVKDHLYNIALGVKRETETMLIGGSTYTPKSISKQTNGIEIRSTYKDYAITAYPKGGAFTIDEAKVSYTSMEASVLLSPETIFALNDAGDNLDKKPTLLVVAAPGKTFNQSLDSEEAYKKGDDLGGGFADFHVPVVYHERPTNLNNITISYDGLKPGKTYYLYAFLGYEHFTYDEDGEKVKDDNNQYVTYWTYSNNLMPLFASEPFETLEVPAPSAVTASAPNGNKVTLTIDAECETCSFMIVKANSVADLKPEGKFEADDVIENYDNWADVTYEGTVAGFTDNKTFDLTLNNEAAYVLVYGVINKGTETAAYSSSMVLTSAGVPVKGLPQTFAFREGDYYQDQPMDAMPVLPPGFSTSTVLGADNEEALLTAFSVNIPSMFSEGEYYLLSDYSRFNELPEVPVWSNFIAPAFYGADKKVQATFNARFIEADEKGMSWPVRNPQAGDSVRIEYSKNGGAWTLATLFTGNNFPEADLENNLPLTVFVECTPTDTVRFRYSYTIKPANETAMVKHLISSIEFVEARDCATPSKLTVAQDGITDESIKVKWNDQNAKPAQNFLVQYIKYVAPVEDDEQGGPMPRTDGEDPDYGGNDPDDDQFGQDVEWQSVMVSTTEALLAELEANTAYTIKVQAVCGANDSSFFTIPVRLSTAAGLPYDESLSSAVDMEAYEVTAPNVKSYIGEPGEDLKEEGLVEFSFGEVKGWSTLSSSMQSYDEEEGPSSYALSISSEAKDKAWIVTPNIYVPKTGDKEPKTLKFKADPYSIVYDDNGDAVLTHGIDLEDEDLRLYVFASTNGKFTWNDTVASFAAADLTFEVPTPAEGETANPKPGKELSVEMDKFEGVMQLGFYFHNPNADPDIDNLTRFLQIFNIEFNYDNTCRPVEKLAYSGVKQTEATLTWKGEGVQYGITYGEASAEESTYKTFYQNAQTTADGTQTIKLEGLKSNTNYKVKMVSYCTAGENPTGGSIARTVTFTTTKQMFTVKVDVQPNAEAGSVEGATSYLEGSEATLTATAKTGFKFAGYFIGENKVSAEATYKFTVTRDTTVIAKFAQVEKYDVTVNVTPAEAGSVTGAGQYNEGSEVTLTATANKGYKFVGYFEGETELSTTATYKFTASKNITITAKFVEDQANETQLRAEFRVSTDNGNLLIGNLGGIKVKDVTVYNLAGRLLNQFAVSSTDNLTLPVNAQRTIIFVRLNTEKGVAVYKVYLQ